MASGRLINLWRRWSQLTAGLSTAARKRAMTNQPRKVRTCHSRRKAPSTTAVVSKATATVRATCQVEARAHPPSLLGMDALGSASVVSGFACGSACEPVCGVLSSFIFQSLLFGGIGLSPPSVTPIVTAFTRGRTRPQHVGIFERGSPYRTGAMWTSENSILLGTWVNRGY